MMPKSFSTCHMRWALQNPLVVGGRVAVDYCTVRHGLHAVRLAPHETGKRNLVAAHLPDQLYDSRSIYRHGLGSSNKSLLPCASTNASAGFAAVDVCVQVDVPRFMSDGQRLDELIQAVKLQHQQEQLQELLESDS